MKLGNWNEVNKELDKLYNEIFDHVKPNKLDYYTKRKMIFDYLCNNIEYDYDLLNKIEQHQINPLYKVERQPYLEIESVLKNRKGICNAIAQVYKLLLEKVGIYSLCVICDDGTKIRHQLNLVYNEEDCFSFDDITSVIVKRGDIIQFFDYDLDMAYLFNQGNDIIYENEKWMILPDYYIYILVGKNNLQNDTNKNELIKLPNNIHSLKKQKNKGF